jgi:hypothetical protein
MFRALTCLSSGGKIVFTQHLLSSLSVNVCTVHWLRADSVACWQYFFHFFVSCVCSFSDTIRSVLITSKTSKKKTAFCFTRFNLCIAYWKKKIHNSTSGIRNCGQSRSLLMAHTINMVLQCVTKSDIWYENVSSGKHEVFTEVLLRI